MWFEVSLVSCRLWSPGVGEVGLNGLINLSMTACCCSAGAYKNPECNSYGVFIP